MDETKLSFFPVLLSATYNEDQIKFLIQKAIQVSIVLCVYIPIENKDSINKTQYIALSPPQVRYVWERQTKITTLHTSDENGIKKTIKTNILGLMTDKNGADYYIELASQGLDPSDLRHYNNIPSLSALSKYNTPNTFNITLSWKEIYELKHQIVSETPKTRKNRIKERTENYMKLASNYNPSKKEIIEIIYKQECSIRDSLNIAKEDQPKIGTYERDG